MLPLQSWTFAPLITTERVPAAASTNRLRLVPGLARSVGFGPVSSLPNRAFALLHLHFATANLLRRVPRTPQLKLPKFDLKRHSAPSVEKFDVQNYHREIHSGVDSTDSHYEDEREMLYKC